MGEKSEDGETLQHILERNSIFSRLVAFGHLTRHGGTGTMITHNKEHSFESANTNLPGNLSAGNSTKENLMLASQTSEDNRSETGKQQKSRHFSLRDICYLVPKRIIVGTMIFLTTSVYFLIYTSFNLLLLAMVKVNESESKDIFQSNVGKRYSWTNTQQTQALCVFQIGEAISSVPAGILVEKTGPRFILGLGIALAGLISFVIPFAARVSISFMCMWRLLQGFCCSEVFMGSHYLISQWAPRNEQCKFVWTILGGMLGTAYTLVLVRKLLEVYEDYFIAFYVIGGISIAWGLIWIVMISDSPRKHPYITQKELNYISKTVEPLIEPKFHFMSFSEVFTSKRFWALLALTVSHENGLFTLITLGPSFFQVFYKKMVSQIEAGLPSPSPPPFSTYYGNKTHDFIDMASHLSSGIAIVPIIAVLGNVAIAKSFSTGTVLDATQEMITLGFCNLVGSFVRSMPINGSFTRSAVNNASGVKTPFGGLYTGIMVMLSLSLLTPYFYFIPKATLSAVIICAVLFMVEVGMVKPIWNSSKRDLVPGFVTLIACLLLGVELGIVIGVAIDIIFLLYFNARPGVEVERTQCSSLDLEYVLVTPNSGLLFPAVDFVRQAVSKAGADEVDIVVLNCRHVVRADFTAAQGIQSLLKDFKKQNKHVIFLNLNPCVAKTLSPEENLITASSEAELVQTIKGLKCNTADASSKEYFKVEMSEVTGVPEIQNIPHSSENNDTRF